MDTKRKLIALLVVLPFFVVGVLTWSPWLQDEEVKSIVRSDIGFQKSHSAGSVTANPEIAILKIPFGRWVTTYEGGWFVWFWQSGT